MYQGIQKEAYEEGFQEALLSMGITKESMEKEAIFGLIGKGLRAAGKFLTTGVGRNLTQAGKARMATGSKQMAKPFTKGLYKAQTRGAGLGNRVMGRAQRAVGRKLQGMGRGMTSTGIGMQIQPGKTVGRGMKNVGKGMVGMKTDGFGGRVGSGVMLTGAGATLLGNRAPRPTSRYTFM